LLLAARLSNWRVNPPQNRRVNFCAKTALSWAATLPNQQCCQPSKLEFYQITLTSQGKSNFFEKIYAFCYKFL
jgi:hypothetical protein